MIRASDARLRTHSLLVKKYDFHAEKIRPVLEQEIFDAIEEGQFHIDFKLEDELTILAMRHCIMPQLEVLGFRCSWGECKIRIDW